MAMVQLKWFCLAIALTACSTPKNNEKPVFGKDHTGIKGGLIIVNAILKIKTVIKNKCHLRVIAQTLIRTLIRTP